MNLQASTVRAKGERMPEEIKDTTEVIEEQEQQAEDIKDSDVEIGEPVTFEDIINHPDYQKEYRKAIDREVSKAIATYQKNHTSDMESVIASKVAEQVNEVKFNTRLNEILKDAGVIDTLAFKAHMDMDALKKAYDPNANDISGMDELIKNTKESLSYLYKKEAPIITGQVQNKFGNGSSKITNLRDALKEKYGK